TLGNVMEALLVDGEDHHLGSAEHARIVERADLDQRRTGQARSARRYVRAAVGAEFPRHRIGEIAATELLRRAFCPREARVGHAHHHVGLASGHVLALPTVTLALEERISRGLVPDRAAVTTAFDFHDCPPCLRLWGHATSGSACALVLAYHLPADLRT